MDYAYSILIVLDLIVAIILAAFILMQQGKGASMGASFGAGASNTLFGSVGSANFFVKSTWILATVFAVLTISLGYITTHRSKLSSDDFSVIVAEDKKSASADENKADTEKKSASADESKADTEKKSLTEKAGEAVDKAAEQAKATYEDGKQAVGNAAEQAKAAYEDGKQAVSDAADSVQNKVSEAVDQVNDKVAEVNKAVGENVEAAKASLNNAADDVKKVVTPDPAESVDKKETNTTETEK